MELRFTCKFNHFTCSKTHILFNIYWSHTGKPTPVLLILSLRYFWPSFTPMACFLCLYFGLNRSFPITLTVSELIFFFYFPSVPVINLSAFTSNSPSFSHLCDLIARLYKHFSFANRHNVRFFQ